jgi:hypothetical protein
MGKQYIAYNLKVEKRKTSGAVAARDDLAIYTGSGHAIIG